jgi:hypothetical protein
MRWTIVGAAILCSVGLSACSGTGEGPAVPRPSGWKTVNYHGVGIDVPRTWTVRPWVPNCGALKPTVFIGPERLVELKCFRVSFPAAEVVLGSLYRFPRGTGKAESINGLRAVVVTEHGVNQRLGVTRGQVTKYWVMLPDSGFSISVSVAESSALPGGAAGRAEEIVHTIHATAHATASACSSSPAWSSITLSDQSPRPKLTVPVGAEVVVNVPGWSGGDATDVHIGGAHPLQEQCSVLLGNHGRRTILLATAPGRSDLEATTSGLPSGVMMPAWLGTVQVTS